MPACNIPHVRMDDRLSIRYLEKCNIVVVDGTIMILSKITGKQSLCVEGIACLMLGCGTSISRDAVKLLSDSNVTVVWCGRSGMSMYTVGMNVQSSMKNAKEQINRIMTKRQQLWRLLLKYRRIESNVKMGVKQLLLVEATAMKQAYDGLSKFYGVEWSGRIPQVSDMDPDDRLNFAITVCNMALYGVATACITAMGFLPQFGVIHGNGSTPLAYDLADVYKVDTTIPCAMKYVVSHTETDVNELLSDLSNELNKFKITRKFTSLLEDLFIRDVA